MPSLKSRLILLLLVLLPLFSNAQNNALNFDGADDHISCGDIDLFSFTFQANVKVPSIGQYTILSKGDGNGVGENYIFQVQNGTLALNMYQGASNWSYSNTNIPNNTWCHVAVTYDNTTRMSTFYINGVFSGTSMHLSVDPFQDNNPTYIGRQGTACNCNYFNGEIDEVSIWNRPLTCDEINSWKNCHLQGNEPGLLDYYQFNQGTAGGNNLGTTTLPDVGPGNKPGTLTNFTLNATTSNWVSTGASVGGTCVASTTREINLIGNSNTIAGDGSNVPTEFNHTDYSMILPFTSVMRTYTIQNPGTGSLTVNDITVSGADASLFLRSAVSFPLILVAGGSETFDVTFTPENTGVKNAQITIISDDCDEANFQFDIKGEGGFGGQALNFDGTNSNVRIPFDPSLNLSTGNFTVEFWAKPTLVDSDHHWVIAKDEGNGDLDYAVAIASNNKWLFAARNLSIFLSGTSTVVPGNYYHVACVLNNGRATLYVNGVQEATTTVVGSPGTNTSNVIIGARTASTPQQFFQGDIDEVRLWNRGLCLDEINNNRNCEIPVSANGLVGNYHFNSGVAGGTNYGVNTLYDNAGGDNNGTLFGMTYVGATANWITPGGVTQGNVCATFNAPEIAIKGNGNLIPFDGTNVPNGADNTDFGSVAVGSPQDFTFVIENSGSAPLSLTPVPANVKLSGSSDYTLFLDANSIVNPAGSTSFTIRFTPSSAGVKTVIVTVMSNDCDEGNYIYNITGNGVSVSPANVLRFDGLDDYIETGYIPTSDEAAQFTLECWVKGDASPSMASDYNGPLYGNMLAIIWDHQDPDFVGSASVMDASNTYYTASFGPLTGGTWYHLAATYDGTTLKSYTNGVLQNSVTTGGGIKYNGTNSLKIGTHPNTALNYKVFAGSIDEVRVWSRALSASEIASNRNCNLAMPYECLQLYYKFNQGIIDGTNTSQTSLTDASGKNRNGTFNNFALSGGASSNFTGGTPVSIFASSCSPLFFPEVDLKGNNLSILNNDTTPSLSDSTDFGDVITTAAGNVNTFTIWNFGTGSTLTLSGSPKVTITGSSAFTLEADAGSATLGSFGSTTFRILFKPTSLGLKTATVLVQNSDCDEGNYTFTIQGTGTYAGASLQSSGASEYISLNNSTDFNFIETDSFTVECWVAYSSIQQDVIFSKLTNGAPYNGYELSVQNGRINFMMCSNFGTSNYLNLTTVTPFNNNIWHHVAVVYPGIPDASKIKIYVDGIVRATTISQNTLTGSISNSNIAHIAARGNVGQSLFYTGMLDEIRVWDRALCASEIASFRDCEKTGAEPGLIACYHFNQGEQGGNNTAVTTLIDAAGGNNNGTLVGFSLVSGFNSDWNGSGGVITGAVCGGILQPEILVTGNSLSITSGDVTPSPSDFTAFGNQGINVQTEKIFTIRNTGNAILDFNNIPTIGTTGSADFIIIQPTSVPLGPGTSDIFKVQFKPSSPGFKTAVVTIVSNDCDEPDFTFTVSGTGVPPPEINLKQNISNIASGGNFAFGNHVVNNPNSGRIFTIENISVGGKLALNGSPKVELIGGDVNQFSLNIVSLPDTIQPSLSADFNLKFMPLTAGVKTAQLRIANNDPDENPYLITITGNGVVAGDVDSSGSISAGEITGDTSGNGSIEFPSEVTGDINGNGSIGTGEIAGDNDGDGQINNGEIAGNTNGTGGIDNGELSGDIDGSGGINGNEFTGDVNGNGVQDPSELIGDVDGNGVITAPEVLGDINGDGIADPDPSYVLVGKGTIVSNYISRYIIQPELPDYFTYAWVYSDESLYMIKDTTRYFMDVVASNQTNNGILTCRIFRFGVPYDTLDFSVAINKNYLNISELAELSAECAAVANPANDCQESFIDYFKLNTINYDGNGCVRGGYQDLTGTGYTTDLEMGFTYTIELKPNKLLFFPNPLNPSQNDTTNVFYAVWIDYNNDGDFEDFAEYVKNGDSKSASTKLINITIANNDLYEGSRRLRVGMKTGSGFSSSDACGISAIGTSGELEDYLITLVPMGALQAPNFLSPNNDGENDLFSIKGVNAEKSRILTILNKAGNVVYQEENYGDKELWGGKDNSGELLQKGTYYYIFKNGSEELKSFLEIDY